MERIQYIQLHPLFQSELGKLTEAEKDRIFCKHDIAHFLDVARLMYLWNLEDGAGLDRDVVYAAALLHDIGRFRQIEDGTPHHAASARLAEPILAECGFCPEEIREIQAAILSHRTSIDAENTPLGRYLYHADKLSRSCFACPAEAQCYWPQTKKNRYITY